RSEIEQLFRDYMPEEDNNVFEGAVTAKADPIPGRDLSGTIMCARCLITSDVPNAKIQQEGDTCYYCSLHDSLNAQYPLGLESDQALDAFIERLKAAGKGKKY